MKNQLKKDNKGFTIIEVLIVLAIAGLILLIVFLAVPALQRNSRNTQRKNDVSKRVSLLSEAANNNNGVLPIGTTTPQVIRDDRYSQFNVTTDVTNGTDEGMNYNVVDPTGATPPNPFSGDLGKATVIVRNGYKCNPNVEAPTDTDGTVTIAAPAADGWINTTGATKRNVVVIYLVEQNGNSVQAQCVDN